MAGRGLAFAGAAGLALAAARGALGAAAFARTAAPPRAAERRTRLRASGSPEALQERLPSPASAAHRARREKAAGAAAASQPARSHGNAKVRLNNLVSKTVRRSLLSGDVVYSGAQEPDGSFAASVRIAALEEGEELSFTGLGPNRLSAERSAAEAALRALPPAPDFEPRYPRPEVAAVWIAEQLEAGDAPVEVDSTMADVLPTLAHLPEALRASALYVLENEDPCRVRIRRDPELDAASRGTARSMQVSGRTQAGKLAAAMRVRLLGEEGEQRHDALELRFAGKSACKEAAIAVKILQRFFPSSARGPPRFRARFERFEGYRKQGLVVSVAA